ncbi:unnamed protein product, partial [marine sediment metagenome]
MFKKNIQSNTILYFICISLILFSLSVGCTGSISTPSTDSSSSPVGPTSGYLIIEKGADLIKDCTPSLTIHSERAAYMSFSGDGVNWCEWIEYSTSYEEFNIANGSNGTEFSSGIKYIYVRFKDEEGNLSPFVELAFDTIEYEMGKLFSIKIFPQEVAIPTGGSHLFSLHGYDLKLNEVPLDSSKVTWTKCCGVGELSPTKGLSTTYTAPSIPGKWNITAQYNNLKTG